MATAVNTNGSPARAVRTATLLVVLADAMFLTSVIAGDGYLRALNVVNAYHPARQPQPDIVSGLAIAAIAVASAAAYWTAQRGLHRGNARLFRNGLWVALALAVAGLAGQIVFVTSLPYAAPVHAYAAAVTLMGWIHVLHMVLTVIVGTLVAGRVWRGRMTGHEHIADAAGYWWYYVAVAAVAVWIAGFAIS